MRSQDKRKCACFLRENNAHVSIDEIKSTRPDVMARKRKFRKLKRRFIKAYPKLAFVINNPDYHPLYWVYLYLCKTRRFHDYCRHYRPQTQ